ncbi:MAG: alkaline phosphatase family protein [Pyrinomonadaceae bacterium]
MTVKLLHPTKIHRRRNGAFIFTAPLLLMLLLAANVCAQTKRVVVIKVDGLPYDMVDRFARERDARTGKSLLPWMTHVFYERGTRVANFYVRGMSLSGPSWSLLDTGQHLQIKSNVEFDRYTLHSYDYLNFIPFYINYSLSRRVDMAGPEVLDEVGVPLLIDAYPYAERHQSFQLHQRGVRWSTLERGLKNSLAISPRELIDEWTTGFDTRNVVMNQLERELIEKLNDPRIRYLDFYTTEFDHAAHHNRDRQTHLLAMQDVDALVGRIWTAIQKSPLAADTTLILVSDHGTNTDERVYSQGYNLVKLLGSQAGGGHHVITKRRVMNDYALKGIYPLVPLITTTTPDSYYLKNQSTDYPTALLDFDGNERAAIHLRDSDLNVLHILLQTLQRKNTDARLRSALTNAFFATIERRRSEWEKDLAGLREELDALRLLIDKQRAITESQPKKWTQADKDAGIDQESRRIYARTEAMISDERKYTEYAQTLSNLLALRRENFEPQRIKIEDVIQKGAMGDHNSINELQNYVAGVASNGFVLNDTGALDMEKSFARVDYFSLLHNQTVRNNVQTGVGNRPLDFVAAIISTPLLKGLIEDDASKLSQAIWLYGGQDKQALILARENEQGQVSLRYLPVRNLIQDADGAIHFERAEWSEGFPLKIWEDAALKVPEGNSNNAWLSAWHTDTEWLEALHRTKYSNGLVGLAEQFIRHKADALDANAQGLSRNEKLLREFRQRQRDLVATDLLLVASDHWNFDVRGFNPGGNHGSFFRVSTHATLMFAGGARTGIPRGLSVEEPYDSLSFMPTVLALTNALEDDGRTPVSNLWQKGFRSFPGRLIEEVTTPGAGSREKVPLKTENFGAAP